MHNSAQLAIIANDVRRDIIKMLSYAGSGHSGGSLGMADVFVALYFYLLKQNPHEPWDNDWDKVILSSGHICPVLYTTLAHAGYFPKEELLTLRQMNSRLQGHPHLRSLPGIENTSGPLGQGISQAVGLALAHKMDKSASRVICIMGDGEQQEGQCWEAYLAASKYRLDNLTIFVDRNNIQLDGYVQNIMPIEPLKEKYEAFGLCVLEIDGHNFDEIIDAYHKSLVIHGKPTLIICHTIPGKSVAFMENDPAWHGKVPGVGETIEALRDLREDDFVINE